MKGKKIALIGILVVIIILSVIFILDSTTSTSNTEDSGDKSNGIENINTSKLVIGDDYFIEQINDIYYNPDDYYGRTVEIEGFPLLNEEGGYTFVGRYGPGCCVGDGYAYIEYQYSKEIELVDEEDWIKVNGIFKKGIDNGVEYIYIEATNIEKMAERGKDTVLL